MCVGLVACGGREEGAHAQTVDAGATYVESVTDTLPRSAPSTTWSLSVSCEAPDAFLDGGCVVGTGGELVESAHVAHGWSCAIVAHQDDVTLTASAECQRAP